MNYKDIFAKLCGIAPIELSDKLVKLEDGYDNSGIIVGNNGNINKILFCLDLTCESVKAAIKVNADMIVTHHPAIYRPVKAVAENSPLYECIRNNIAVISMHLNLDCAQEGIDYYFAEGLGGKITEIIEPLGDNVGYGRVSELHNVTAKDLARRYREVFSTDKFWLYGDENKKIERLASFCGSGLDETAVDEAVKRGADAVASADIPHHVLLKALECGLIVLSCTHYATENYGAGKFADKCREILKSKEIYFFRDERFA